MSTSTVDVARIKDLMARVEALEKSVVVLQGSVSVLQTQPVKNTLSLPKRTEREGARN